MDHHPGGGHWFAAGLSPQVSLLPLCYVLVAISLSGYGHRIPGRVLSYLTMLSTSFSEVSFCISVPIANDCVTVPDLF